MIPNREARVRPKSWTKGRFGPDPNRVRSAGPQRATLVPNFAYFLLRLRSYFKNHSQKPLIPLQVSFLFHFTKKYFPLLHFSKISLKFLKFFNLNTKFLVFCNSRRYSLTVSITSSGLCLSTQNLIEYVKTGSSFLSVLMIFQVVVLFENPKNVTFGCFGGAKLQ